MSTKLTNITFTPILGGRTDGSVCSLLEIAGCRILLDAGGYSDDELTSLSRSIKYLKESGGVDLILLSHADVDHIGGLAVLLGSKGLQSVPVLCTLPVFKFGQILLYDIFLNRDMEGTDYQTKFDINDIDHAFSNTKTLKFSQYLNVSDVICNQPGSEMLPVKAECLQSLSVCAIPSGRTIGGASWIIRSGPTEIFYCVDFNLKKELVLDGASLSLLPTAPALMIVDAANSAGGGVASYTASSSGGGRRKKTDRGDEYNALINAVLETLRLGGNVLIPCETAGRALELLHVLSRHWSDKKLGLDHLIFLSHMSRNTPEFARMQLEWMSDTLSREFYNGKPNPFDLPSVKLVTSTRDMDRRYPGPKVVLATESGLSYGLSKEVLLKWGGMK